MILVQQAPMQQTPGAQVPIPQLADIHLPGEIALWPPAPGWWLLFILVVSTLCWAIWYCLKRYRRNRYRRLALNELEEVYKQYQRDQDYSQYLQAANYLLKKTVHAGFPPSTNLRQPASLSGRAWLAFLDSTFGKTLQTVMQDKAGMLINGPYQRGEQLATETSVQDIASLNALLQRWIREHNQDYPNPPKSSNEAVA